MYIRPERISGTSQTLPVEVNRALLSDDIVMHLNKLVTSILIHLNSHAGFRGTPPPVIKYTTILLVSSDVFDNELNIEFINISAHS